jgi:hypothetical protein
MEKDGRRDDAIASNEMKNEMSILLPHPPPRGGPTPEIVG